MTKKLKFISIFAVIIALLALVFFALLPTSRVQAASDIQLQVDLSLNSENHYTGSPVTVVPKFWTKTGEEDWAPLALSADKYTVTYYNSTGTEIAPPSQVGTYTAKVFLNYETTQYYFINANDIRLDTITPSTLLAEYTYDILPYGFTIDYSLYPTYQPLTAYAQGSVVRFMGKYYSAISDLDASTDAFNHTDWEEISVSERVRTAGANLYSQLSASVIYGGVALEEGVDYTFKVLDSEDSETTVVSAAGEYSFQITILNDKLGLSAGTVFKRSFFLTDNNLFARLNKNVYYFGESVTPSLADSIATDTGVNLKTYASSTEISYFQLYPLYESGKAYKVGHGVRKDGISYRCIQAVDKNEGWNKTKWEIVADYYRKLEAPSQEIGSYVYRVKVTAPINGANVGDYIDLPYEVRPVPFTVKYKLEGASTYLSEEKGYSFYNDTNTPRNIIPEFYNASGQRLNVGYQVSYSQYNIVLNDFTALSSEEKPKEMGRYKMTVTLTQPLTVGGYTLPENSSFSQVFSIVNNLDYSNLEVENFYTGNSIDLNPEIVYGTTECANLPGLTYFYIFYFYQGSWKRVAPTEVGNYTACIVFNKNFTVGGTVRAKGAGLEFPETASFADFASGDKFYFDYKIIYPACDVKITYDNGFGVQSSVDNLPDYGLSADKILNFTYEENLTKVYAGIEFPIGKYAHVLQATATNGALGILTGDEFKLDRTVTPALTIENISFKAPDDNFDGSFKVLEITTPTLQLSERTDYFVSYYDSNYNSVEYPYYPGDYTAVVSFIRDIPTYGIATGDAKILTFTVRPQTLIARFEASDDLVYDKESKEFTLSFLTDNDRPALDIAIEDYQITYSNDEHSHSLSNAFVKDAGDYTVSAVFNKSFLHYGIKFVDNDSIDESETINKNFAIEVLELTLNASIPVEEKSMYRLGVQPQYEFVKNNQGKTEVVDFLALGSDYLVSYRAATEDGYETTPYDVPTARAHQYATNKYLAEFVLQNKANVKINNVVKVLYGAHEGESYSEDIYFANLSDNKENLQVGFEIIPLPLFPIMQIDGTDDTFFYSDSSEKEIEKYHFYTIDPLAVEEGFTLTRESIKENLTSGILVDVASLFGVVGDNDLSSASFTTKFYHRETGSSTIRDEAMATAPVLPGDYTIRIVFDNGDSDFLYSCYTVNNSFSQSGASILVGTPVKENDYFDTAITVKTPDVLKLVVEKPSSFADGKDKDFLKNGFNISFIDGNEKVLTKGVDYDVYYTYGDNTGIARELGTEGYLKLEANQSTEYKLVIKFKKNFSCYTLSFNEGVYTKYDNTNPTTAICQNDTYNYSFAIFKAPVLQWDFIQPENFYFSGEQKTFGVEFYTMTDGVRERVTLIENADYKLNYYLGTTSEGGRFHYEFLSSGAPVNPSIEGENYIVELVFLRDLDDYLMKKSNGADPYDWVVSYQSPNAIPRLLDNNGLLNVEHIESNLVNSESGFKINKAVLTLGGFQIQDKPFDNLSSATIVGKPSLTIAFDENNKPMGKLIAVDGETFVFEGNLHANFESVFVGEDISIILAASGKGVSGNGFDYYTLVLPEHSAKITKREILVTPNAVTAQYNPFEDELDNLSFVIKQGDADIFTSLCGSTNLFIGSLSRDKGADGMGKTVGSYPISKGTLAFSTATLTTSDGITCTADQLFVLKVSETNTLGNPATYDIIKREISIGVKDGQSKIYGSDDKSLETCILQGSLIMGDSYTCAVKRSAGENVGEYDISISDVKILDSQGNDVGENYNVTVFSGSYKILKRDVTLQFIFGGEAFNGYTVNELSKYLIYKIVGKDGNRDLKLCKYLETNVNASTKGTYYVKNGLEYIPVTLPDDYNKSTKYYSLNTGDYLDGKLELIQVESFDVGTVVKYRVNKGSLQIYKTVDGKNVAVTNNYNISYKFDNATEEKSYYSVFARPVTFTIPDSGPMTSVYGVGLPLIAVYTDKLPAGYSYKGYVGMYREDADGTKTTLSAGEVVDVGEYGFYEDNALGLIKIYDSNNKDVTKYFDISIDTKAVSGTTSYAKTYKVTRRPVIITVHQETVYREEGVVQPRIRFMSDEYSELSDGLVTLLKGKYGFGDITYTEGENTIIPIKLEGNDDKNFEITFKEGVIQVVYPENNITLSPDEVDVYQKDELIFGGHPLFMIGETQIVLPGVFRAKHVFEVHSQSDDDPSHSLTLSVPLPKDLDGERVYLLAVYGDGSMALVKPTTVDGATMTFEDARFKYVVLATMEIWPYILVGAILLFIIILIIALCVYGAKHRKKAKKIEEITTPTESTEGEETTEDTTDTTEEPTAREDEETTEIIEEEEEEVIEARRPLAEESDEIVVSPSRRSFAEEEEVDDDELVVTSDSSSEDDDDEIIIRKTSRSFDDDTSDDDSPADM